MKNKQEKCVVPISDTSGSIVFLDNRYSMREIDPIITEDSDDGEMVNEDI